VSLDVAALWEAEAPGLRRFIASRLGKQRGDTEELLSDVFERVWTKRHLYRETPTGSPHTWLYAIAANRLTDYWRRWKPHYSLEAVAGSWYAVRFDNVETRAVVADAITSLSERQRTVIVGRFYEGRTQSEFDGITPEGVKKLSARAYANLRRRLECTA